jgi:hypothetical protein
MKVSTEASPWRMMTMMKRWFHGERRAADDFESAGAWKNTPEMMTRGMTHDS